MHRDWVVRVAAIGAIAALAVVSVLSGLNHQVVTLAMLLVAGLAGYTIGSRRGVC